jgi:hypothetical protein
LILRFINVIIFINLALVPFAMAQQVDFGKQIRPILSDRCYICHGPDGGQRKAGLRLDLETGAEQVLSPGDADNSELTRRIESGDRDEMMPPPDSKLSLSKQEIQTIRQWIEEGARWDQHWSFVAPVKPPLPQPNNVAAVGNEIDNFILARLDLEGLSPALPTSKEKFIRRVSFDLCGLPPTLEEIDAFLADDSPTAYEEVVDRLLASSRFGERMAADWLDVARYSDTYGYQVDRDRFVWPWRDWVVRSFNANMPYDQFITEQLAGDLLPDATDQQILATTFNRLHPQKVEGGSVEEEFRVEYVADRSQTVGMALLGLTVECARCHDHKFDPISQKEYYQLFAFFNNIDEAGLYSFFDADAVPTPTLLLLDDQQKQHLNEMRAELAESGSRLEAVRRDRFELFDRWLEDWKLRKLAIEELTPGLVLDVDFAKTSHAENVLFEGPGGKKAIKLTGDDEVKLDEGKVRRFQPFSIVSRIKIPPQPENIPIERNVVFHCSKAWTDSASRGYELLIENGRLKASLIHFWPGNAISVRTQQPVATDRWIHVAMAYDGSSKASGIQIYVDGKLQPIDIVRDNLQKAILGDGTLSLSIGARFRDRGFTDGQVSELKLFDRSLTAIEVAQLHDGNSLMTILKRRRDGISSAEIKQLRDYFFANHCQEFREELLKLSQQREEIAKFIDAQQEIMVMRELPSSRPAFVLQRGAYDAPQSPVRTNTPAVFPSIELDSDRPANRLDLARWLTSGHHPLTSRVAVNRIWQQLFGQGLVRTPEDFGSQGTPPTHPELLDWLAVDFEKDWDVKRAIKRIVMSNTYRQSTSTSKELLQRDPDNELLARAPTYRLPAEMLRDNVLLVSGLLVEKIGGPPVRPYDVSVAFKPSHPDVGEGLYRRSLYTYWKRTGPVPVMLMLDAAKRDVCQVKRERTSSPLQSLVLLNGPQFIEAARKMSERLILQHGKETNLLATDMFRALTSRQPTTKELGIVVGLYEKQLAEYAQNVTAASQLLSIGDTRSETSEPAQLAAWTVVANTLMNFDECVMKR